MSGAPWTTVGRAFRRAALPLVAYYTVTLAMPLANNAAHSDAFLKHALAVLVVPPLVILLACAVHTIARALARACDPFYVPRIGWLRGRAASLLAVVEWSGVRWRHDKPSYSCDGRPAGARPALI